MTDSREAKLSKVAAGHGVTLEKGGHGYYRLVDATTGTWVAADWLTVDGYGLSLDEVEMAITGL